MVCCGYSCACLYCNTTLVEILSICVSGEKQRDHGFKLSAAFTLFIHFTVSQDTLTAIWPFTACWVSALQRSSKHMFKVYVIPLESGTTSWMLSQQMMRLASTRTAQQILAELWPIWLYSYLTCSCKNVVSLCFQEDVCAPSRHV